MNKKLNYVDSIYLNIYRCIAYICNMDYSAD